MTDKHVDYCEMMIGVITAVTWQELLLHESCENSRNLRPYLTKVGHALLYFVSLFSFASYECSPPAFSEGASAPHTQQPCHSITKQHVKRGTDAGQINTDKDYIQMNTDEYKSTMSYLKNSKYYVWLDSLSEWKFCCCCFVCVAGKESLDVFPRKLLWSGKLGTFIYLFCHVRAFIVAPYPMHAGVG